MMGDRPGQQKAGGLLAFSLGTCIIVVHIATHIAAQKSDKQNVSRLPVFYSLESHDLCRCFYQFTLCFLTYINVLLKEKSGVN